MSVPPTPTHAESILDTVKKALGIDPGLTVFDPDLVMHINATFMTLHQLGVGVATHSITDRSDTWDEYIVPAGTIEVVKSYIYVKVKIVFDPPPTAYGIQSLEKMAEQYEWRLNVQAETEQNHAPLTQ